MDIEGGYKTQTVTQIANLISAFDAKMITLRAARVYIAALAITASREAAERSRKPEKRKRVVTPEYKLKELSRATGVSLTRIRKEVKSLEAAGLMQFSESEIIFTETPLNGSGELADELSGGRSRVRPVPIPRQTLRYLARSNKASTIKTMLCYVVRGLTIARQGGEITGKGSVKASWIADVCKLSLRSVRAARASFISMGWISGDENSTQHKLNRTGAYFEINLSWKGNIKNVSKRVFHREGSEGAQNPVAERVPVVNSLSTTLEFAPLQGQKCSNFAPPYKDKKTSSKEEVKNQKAFANQKSSGVFTKQIGINKKGRGRGQASLFDVTREALFSFKQVERLYFEACILGLIENCEASALNFLSAAIRARQAKNGDSARIFASIIRRKLWDHITQAEEGQARAALLRYREMNQERFRFEEWRHAA